MNPTCINNNTNKVSVRIGEDQKSHTIEFNFCEPYTMEQIKYLNKKCDKIFVDAVSIDVYNGPQLFSGIYHELTVYGYSKEFVFDLANKIAELLGTFVLDLTSVF